jgi:putative methionine-R-sulfoxide reductase with GAF domain
MSCEHAGLEAAILLVLAKRSDRIECIREIAELIRISGSYRWVGLYDIDYVSDTVKNLAWSGPCVPDFPSFAITMGLTATVVSTGEAVNVGDVASNHRYLSAFSTTKSEIIIPIINDTDAKVVGTLDVESEMPFAFDADVESRLKRYAALIAPLWQS